MVLKKKSGITKIQLPESMRKVPESKTCNETWVAILIMNKFPSDENNCMGRFLDPELSTTKSWKEKDRKPLSKMYRRMLIGYGVEESAVERYAKLSKYPNNLKHGKSY